MKNVIDSIYQSRFFFYPMAFSIIIPNLFMPSTTHYIAPLGILMSLTLIILFKAGWKVWLIFFMPITILSLLFYYYMIHGSLDLFEWYISSFVFFAFLPMPIAGIVFGGNGKIADKIGI